MALISAAHTLAMILVLEGEPITYLEPGREPKLMTGMIERQPKDAMTFGGDGTQHGRTRLHLTIPNDDSTGMVTIRPGQDKVELSRHVGDDEETTFVVSSILMEDQGAWQLELTK